jgi:hypothetical protein
MLMPFEGNPSDAGITWETVEANRAGALERFTFGPDYLCEFGSTSFQRLFEHQIPDSSENAGED